MSCKCGARSLQNHVARIARGQMAGHVYTGPYSESSAQAERRGREAQKTTATTSHTLASLT